MHLSAILVFAALSTLCPVQSLVTTGNYSLTPPLEEFSYVGLNGPLGWTRGSKENPTCSNGTNQSPINLDSTTPVSKATVKLTIHDGTSMLENSQHTLRVDKEGTLIFGEEEYYLGQYHFHTPSEHLINDEFYPMEMHLAFRAAGATDADPFTLAIGILFEVYADATTELLTTLAKCLPKTENQAVETGELIYGPIIRHFEENGLYQYQGSLTTPPCYQGITWLVSEKTMDVDVATFKAFKSIMKFNARYPQNTPGQENLITFAKDHYPEV